LACAAPSWPVRQAPDHAAPLSAPARHPPRRLAVDETSHPPGRDLTLQHGAEPPLLPCSTGHRHHRKPPRRPCSTTAHAAPSCPFTCAS
jgi:hypothetical protein